MTQALRYAWTAIAILVVSVGLAWPWLDGPGRTGLFTAAGVAFLVQVVAFTLLSAHRAPPNRFLAAWVGGTLVRLGVVIAAGVGISRLPGLPPTTTLIGLAGFFFALLLLEPVFIKDRTDARVEQA